MVVRRNRERECEKKHEFVLSENTKQTDLMSVNKCQVYNNF